MQAERYFVLLITEEGVSEEYKRLQLNISPVAPLSPSALPAAPGDHHSLRATSTPDHTRAGRRTQLKGWNSSFYWTSGLTHINYSTLSSRITESFISYLSKATYQPTAFRLQSLPSAKVEPSHAQTRTTAAPLYSPTLMAAAPLMGAWISGAVGIAPSTLLPRACRRSWAKFSHRATWIPPCIPGQGRWQAKCLYLCPALWWEAIRKYLQANIEVCYPHCCRGLRLFRNGPKRQVWAHKQTFSNRN